VFTVEAHHTTVLDGEWVECDTYAYDSLKINSYYFSPPLLTSYYKTRLVTFMFVCY